MVSKSNHNEQTDADILQYKKDILRARDIMPPYKKTSEKTTHPADATEISAEKEKMRHNDTTETQADQIKPGKEKQAEPVRAQQEKSEIPRFDLAEKIMAEQRKITAIRRKAPGKKIETQKAEPVGYTIGQPIPAQPYYEQVIAEIVARDIKKMCRGDYSANSNW